MRARYRGDPTDEGISPRTREADSTVLDELAALAKVADIDAQALSAETELAQIPARLASLDADVRRLQGLLAAERQELADADSLLSAQDEGILGQGAELARSKGKSARARTAREVDAVERELEAIRRTMKERETERENLKAAIAKRRASLEKHASEFTELENYANTEKEKARVRIAELEALRDHVLAGRQVLAAKIPADVLRRYDLIRRKRGGVGMAEVQQSICAGCNTSLPPNQCIAIQKGETFEQCPRCQRMLYAPEVVRKIEERQQQSPA